MLDGDERSVQLNTWKSIFQGRHCGNRKHHKNLKAYRVQKDNEDLTGVIAGLDSRITPFIQDADDNLYCLTHGKMS